MSVEEHLKMARSAMQSYGAKLIHRKRRDQVALDLIWAQNHIMMALTEAVQDLGRDPERDMREVSKEISDAAQRQRQSQTKQGILAGAMTTGNEAVGAGRVNLKGASVKEAKDFIEKMPSDQASDQAFWASQAGWEILVYRSPLDDGDLGRPYRLSVPKAEVFNWAYDGGLSKTNDRIPVFLEAQALIASRTGVLAGAGDMHIRYVDSIAELLPQIDVHVQELPRYRARKVWTVEVLESEGDWALWIPDLAAGLSVPLDRPRAILAEEARRFILGATDYASMDDIAVEMVRSPL